MKKAFSTRAIVAGIIVYLVLLGLGMWAAIYEGNSRNNLFSSRWWDQATELLFYITAVFAILYFLIVIFVYWIRSMMRDLDGKPQPAEENKPEHPNAPLDAPEISVTAVPAKKTALEKMISAWAAPQQAVSLQEGENDELPEMFATQIINRFHRMPGKLRLTNKRFIFIPGKVMRKLLPFSKTQQPISISRDEIVRIAYRKVPRNKYMDIFTRSGDKFTFLTLKRNPALIAPFIQHKEAITSTVNPVLQTSPEIKQVVSKNDPLAETTLPDEIPVFDSAFDKNGMLKPARSMNFFIVFFLGLAFGMSILAAVLYVLLVWFIPFLYVKFLITLFAGVMSGICIAAAVHFGGMHNRIMGYSLGVLAAVFSLYCAWAMYCSMIDNVAEKVGVGSFSFVTTTFDINKAWPYFLHPTAIIEKAKIINHIGAYSYRGTVINGWSLGLVWLGELALYITGAISIVRMEFKKIAEGNEEVDDVSEKIEPVTD